MAIDVDSVSADLTQELALTPLEKKLPPKLLYRFRKWMKQFRGPHAAQPQVQKSLAIAFDHMEAVKSLKKHEVMTSIYDTGAIRMDFGSDVDKKVKDAAMRWAKNRGLRATEASLDKATGSPSYVTYEPQSSRPKGVPTKWTKHTSK